MEPVNNFSEAGAFRPDVPIFSLLDQAAQAYPDRQAFIFQNTRCTYAALQRKAEQCAAALRALGVRNGDRVAVLLPNLPQTIIAFWGIMKAGATAVMTNPLYQEKELVHHFNDCGAKHLIMLDLLWPRISSLRDRLPIGKYIVTTIGDSLSFPLNLLYAFKSLRQHPSHPVPAHDENVIPWKQLIKTGQRYSARIDHPETQPALLQYTGGTTGLPKGVMLTHSNLAANTVQILTALQQKAETEHTFISLLPFFHVYGLSTGMIIPAALAATSLPMPRYVPQDVLHLIRKWKPTIFPGAPSIYISLLQQKSLQDYDLKSLRLCISGSAPLPREIFRRFQSITGATIVEGFGLTEASPITHITPLAVSARREGSIGKPLPATEARLMAEDGSIVTEPGQKGELLIRGPQVMHGYWNNDAETAATLQDGWLRTGDIATVDKDGYYYIIDRKKDMVLIGGYNVYPREIDEVLLEHPQVLEAVAVGIEDEVRGEIIKAYVVPRPGADLTRAEITTWCRAKLASYKVPRLVEFRQELPKTMVGKVLPRALREEERQKREARAAAKAAAKES